MGATIGIYLVMGTAALALLPQSPFTATINALDTIPYLSWVNWVLPISEIIVIVELWLVAVGTYYVIQMLLRWIKIVR